MFTVALFLLSLGVADSRHFLMGERMENKLTWTRTRACKCKIRIIFLEKLRFLVFITFPTRRFGEEAWDERTDRLTDIQLLYKWNIKEYIQATRITNGNFGYSNHTQKTGHTCGNIKDTIDIIRVKQRKKENI